MGIMLTLDQRYVRKMAALGSFSAIATIGAAWMISPAIFIHSINGLPLRLSAYLLAILIGVVPMVAMIARIAMGRFFGPAILGGNCDPVVEIDVRVLNNTHEQFILFGVSALLLIAVLPEGRLAMAPMLAVAFNFFRFVFWLGYHRKPTMRAFGFAATFYSNILLMVLCVFLIYWLD